MVKYKIEVEKTHEQVPYEGRLQDVAHVMLNLANRFNSNILLWSSYPVPDGSDCVDFEVEIIKTVKPSIQS